MPRDLKPDQWHSEIERCLDFRRDYGLEKYWHQLEGLFYNVHDSQRNSGPNIISATGDALISTLTVPYPCVTLKARAGTVVRKARILETLDEVFVDELYIPQELEMSTLHAYLWGKGIIKVGYDSEFGWDPTLDVGLLEQTPIGMTLSQFDSKGHRLEFGSARPGMPWAESILPHDFLVPYGTRLLRTAPYAIHRVVRHIDLLRQDVKYEGTRNIQPNMSMEDFVKSYTTTMRPYRLGDSVAVYGRARENKSEYVELWEIHDRRTGRVIVLATGHNKFLRNEDDLLQVDGLPFVDVGFIPTARTFWTTPDSYYLRQAQAELTDITIQSQKQRRISVVKFLYDTNMLTAEEAEKALSSEVGAALGVNNKSGQSLKDAIIPLQSPGNMLLYQEAENTRRNARETVGFSRNQMGEYEASGRRTASEAALVDQSSKLRMSRRHVAVQRAYKEIFKKLNGLVIEFWTAPRLAEILDDDGIAEWETYSGPMLKGEYGYQIDFSNETPENKVGSKQEALLIYQMFSQDPTVDPVELRRFVARKMRDPEFSLLFKPGILRGDPNALIRAQMSPEGVQTQGSGAGGLPPQLQGSQQAVPMQGMPDGDREG